MPLSRSILEEVVDYVRHATYLGSSSKEENLLLYSRIEFCRSLVLRAVTEWIESVSPEATILPRDEKEILEKVFLYASLSFAVLAELSHAGNCEEQTGLGVLKLLELGVDESIERLELHHLSNPKLTHVLFVINRHPDSDLQKPHTWGKGYVVDPWSDVQQIIAFNPQQPLDIKTLCNQSPGFKETSFDEIVSSYKIIGNLSKADWLNFVKVLQKLNELITADLFNEIKKGIASNLQRPLSHLEAPLFPALSIENVKNKLAVVCKRYQHLAENETEVKEVKETKSTSSSTILHDLLSTSCVKNFPLSPAADYLINVSNIDEEKNAGSSPLALFVNRPRISRNAGTKQNSLRKDDTQDRLLRNNLT